MPRIRFTEKGLSAIRKKKLVSRTEYTDESFPALGVRVSPAPRGQTYNSMVWFVRMGRGKDRKRESFGRYPGLGIAAARRHAREYLEKATEAEYRGLTVSELGAQYIDHVRRNQIPDIDQKGFDPADLGCGPNSRMCLEGSSTTQWQRWIGNAVPPPAAEQKIPRMFRVSPKIPGKLRQP